MNKSLSLIALLVLAIGAPSAFAGKKKKNAGVPASPDVFAKYDADHSGALSSDEIAAIKAAAATDPDLKKFDTNSDGKFDDNETAAIKPAPAVEPGKKKRKHKKNAGAPAGPDMFARYDADHNGTLSPEEITALKAALATDPDLKKFDTNSDGKFDDNEVAVIKPAPSVAQKKKKKNK